MVGEKGYHSSLDKIEESRVDLFTLAGQESIYNWMPNPIYLYVNDVYLMED